MRQFIVALLERFRDERKSGRTISLAVALYVGVNLADSMYANNVLTDSQEGLIAALLVGVAEYAWRKFRNWRGIKP